MPQTFDSVLVRQLTDGDAFEAEARKLIDESDRKNAENVRFRTEHPIPFQRVRAWVNVLMFVAALPSLIFVLTPIAFGSVPPIWSIAVLGAALLYLSFVRWPEGLPLPHRTGVLADKSRARLLDNASRAARNNARVIDKLAQGGGYVLFLRSFGPEFSEIWRTEGLEDQLRDEPYRIKEYAPDVEVLLLKKLLARTRIPTVTNVLVRVPELSSVASMDECEEIQLPAANWLGCVESLAAGAKASIFVISGGRGTGITQELDSLRRRGIRVMAVCEKRWLEAYAGHLPENVLAVTDTEYQYLHSDPPSPPDPIRVKRSVTKEELREYDRRLAELLADGAGTTPANARASGDARSPLEPALPLARTSDCDQAGPR